MSKLDAPTSLLLLIDLQTRLVPAIDRGADMVANARRLADAAALLAIPTVFTEQSPEKLGRTVADLRAEPEPVFAKTHFDALAAENFPLGLLAGRRPILAGCEAHVCVLQTALGLIDRGWRPVVVADAIGSRRVDNKAAALRRLDRCGVEIVTTEMVLFEWLGASNHPDFRTISKMIR